MRPTIKVFGRSIGDMRVGIPSIDFSFDTGLVEIDAKDREFIVNYILKNIRELHDNGDLLYSFTDEEEDVVRRFPLKDVTKKTQVVIGNFYNFQELRKATMNRLRNSEEDED